MQIKTFEAFNMKDAIRSVRKEFGPEAVILGTKEKSLGVGKGKVVEITAAAHGESRPLGATKEMGFGDTSGLLDLVDQVKVLQVKVNKIGDNQVTRENIESLESGLQELKAILMETLRTKEGSAYKALPGAIASILRQLQVMGISENIIAEMAPYLDSIPAKETSTKDLSDDEYYRAQAIRWMMKRVKVSASLAMIPGSVSVHVFIGATGVGKTSTIAKLAAQYKIKEKKKVLIVSLDNKRLAAIEQMRLYSKVIGVPFESCSNANELANILEKHEDAQLVLIDTAGRNTKNGSNISELKELSEINYPIDFHLVLSTTEKEGQMDRVIRGFSSLGISTIAFTKLDETWSYGEIYNIVHKWNIPLSYFGIGQKVPDDIERASRERVVERVFGL